MGCSSGWKSLGLAYPRCFGLKPFSDMEAEDLNVTLQKAEADTELCMFSLTEQKVCVSEFRTTGQTSASKQKAVGSKADLKNPSKKLASNMKVKILQQNRRAKYRVERGPVY
jgi:hypothetical protein